jgi:hypothetical protein
MLRRSLMLGVAVMVMLSAGCAITDYEGSANHKTSGEAKFWAAEIAFSGTGDPALDGTYAYTAKYSNGAAGHDANMKLYSYRNPVVSSFSRDGQIDRDGDYVQGRSGILGGKFQAYWTATDPAPGCQFYANNIQKHDQAPAIPPIALCDTVEEEIDNDLELQASFGSTGDLISQIWSGAVTGGFTMEVSQVVINGVNFPVSPSASIGATATGLRPARFSIDVSQPGGQALIQAILANTQDRTPVSFGLRFEGGMAVDLPARIKVAFDHAALQNML